VTFKSAFHAEIIARIQAPPSKIAFIGSKLGALQVCACTVHVHAGSNLQSILAFYATKLFPAV